MRTYDKGGNLHMINTIFSCLVCGGIFFLGLCILVWCCSKSNYSFKYQSQKRRFEIYPNKENLKSVSKQFIE